MTETLEIPTWVNGDTAPDASQPFEFFPFAESREELFRFCEATTAYVNEYEVSAVALVDRSARPLGIGLHEYWKRTFPEDKPVPAILFVNPAGFTDQEVTPERVDVEHPRLAEHRDDTVLVVDTCMHWGETMRAVVGGLESGGFEDVHTAVANNKLKLTRMKPDLVMQKRRPIKGCYPFDSEDIVVKGSLLHSDAINHHEGETRRATDLRHEIKRIINECVEGGSAEATSDAGPHYQPIRSRQRTLTGVGAVMGIAAAEVLNITMDPDTAITIGSVLIGGAVGAGYGRLVSAFVQSQQQ